MFDALRTRGLGRGLSGRGVAVVLVVLVGLAVALPFVASAYVTGLMALFVPLVILAVAVDLLWGENRIVSFGHGVFFTLGAYAGGLVLRGETGNVVDRTADLLSATAQPSAFERVLSTLNEIQVAGVPVPGLLIAPLLCGMLGLLIGAMVFRTGSPEVYVPLVTLGAGVIAALALNDVQALGGSNGLGAVPSYTEGTSLGLNGSYIFGVAAVALVYAGYWAFRRSRRGAMWRATGDDPVRMEALGHHVHRMRALGFAASAALAGLAGAVYVGAAGYIGPASAGVAFSTQALIWVAVGGVGTFLGPLVGVMFVKWGEYLLASVLGLAESWQLFLGVILVTVVLVAPKGITGLPGQLGTALTSRRRAPEAVRQPSIP